MANKAIIEVVQKIANDTYIIAGVYTDEQTFKISFSNQINGIRSLEDVRVQLANGLDIALVQKDLVIPLGEFDLTPPEVKPPDPPTPEQEAKIIWQGWVIKLNNARSLSVDNPIRVNYQKQVDDLALEEYF